LGVQTPLEIAGEQLRSHQLTDLFTQALGWQPATASSATECLKQPCLPIAQRDGVIVWHVLLTPRRRFTSVLRADIYATLWPDKSLPAPLVIFVVADKSRSLWCQSLSSRPVSKSALYVMGQPMTLWTFRLRRLMHSSKGLFSTRLESSSEACSDNRLASLVTEISSGISGIDSPKAQQLYSVLTLQRLVFLQQLQVKGWLDGDTWYLQTRFDAAYEPGSSLFFAKCLQPLYRSLALPEIERPLAMQSALGQVPFVGTLFQTHQIEENNSSIAIEDSAFENVLGWLSEQMGADTLNPWISGKFWDWLEQYWRRAEAVSPVDAVETVCDRTLDTLLLERLDRFGKPHNAKNKQATKLSLTSIPAESVLFADPAIYNDSAQTLNDLLFGANATVCRRLIQEILPELRLLDPYCSSGRLLVAFHQRLTDIFSVLTGYIQQTQDAQLKIWHSTVSSLTDSSADSLAGGQRADSAADNSGVILKNIQERILKTVLHGVASAPEVAESAHFQLLLHLVATAQRVEEIEPLVDLEFTVMSGNALVGFITVDTERFDQVNASGSASGTDSVFQGNLLQPLAADSYQTILSEKNIALEHYRARSQVLAQAHSVPSYARAALLREEILALDRRAQHKLDKLMLIHMSQQLGLRYRETQLTAKPQRRPLALADVESLRPFHWGYHFSAVFKRGGFDIVACWPPTGGVKPTVAEFIDWFQDLAEQKNVNEKTMKTSKPALAEADPEVAQAWMGYQDQYACITDYLYRSELYAYQSSAVDGKPARHQLVLERLFVEQACNLLSVQGRGAALVPRQSFEDDRAQPLVRFLQEENGSAFQLISVPLDNSTEPTG